MQRLVALFALMCGCLVAPTLAFAQAQITGVVRDASGLDVVEFRDLKSTCTR
jgi:hypothetical protein